MEDLVSMEEILLIIIIKFLIDVYTDNRESGCISGMSI